MPYKELSIILLLWICAVLGSNYRSGFRTQKDDDYKYRFDINEMEEKSSEREEKSK